MPVTLAVVLVLTVVALVMWRLAERTARTEGRRAARLQQRVIEQRREIAGLHGTAAALRADLARLTAAACLAPDTDPIADLEALYALPAYNPEENR